MRKMLHWIISIVAATAISVMVVAILAGLAYAIYLLVTEATIVVGFVMFMGVTHWIGSYIEKRGWAWNPIDDDTNV